MPAPPEIRWVFRQIGQIEVFAQIKVPNCGDADCHVGIAGKIAVNLQGIAHHRHRDAQAVVGCRGGKHRVHRHADPIGKNHLFGQARHEPGNAKVHVVLFHPMQPLQLGQKIMGLDDGAGGNLGEEGNIRRQNHKVPFRGHRALLHVQQVAHGLKQVEGNAQRQKDVQGSFRQAEGPGKGGNEKMIIFAEAQQGKAENHAGIDKSGLPASFIQPGGGVAHPDDPQQKQQEAHVPVSIEHGICQQEHPVLLLYGFAQLHQRGCRQKEEQKIHGSKAHTRSSSRYAMISSDSIRWPSAFRWPSPGAVLAKP